MVYVIVGRYGGCVNGPSLVVSRRKSHLASRSTVATRVCKSLQSLELRTLFLCVCSTLLKQLAPLFSTEAISRGLFNVERRLLSI